MTSETTQASQDVEQLYRALLAAWNDQRADNFAAFFIEHGRVVGFDGSQMDGQSQIESELSAIFGQHPTPTFVAKVTDVRFLYDETAILDAMAGLIPRGQNDIDPALNSVQAMVATWHRGQWRIAHFQTTPAAFHGRPEMSTKFSQELREELARVRG